MVLSSFSRGLIAVAVAALAACASSADQASPTYQEGYSDGCASAEAEGSRLPQSAQRNAVLYDRDPDYRAGWAAGRGDCAPVRPSNLP